MASNFQTRQINALAQTLHNTRTRLSGAHDVAVLDKVADDLFYMIKADNPRADIDRWTHAVITGEL
jgi:hypothetical protein